MNRRELLGMAAAMPLLPCVAQERPATWTEATIRLVVPASPSGTLDQLARLLASEMGRLSGQRFIVENRAGGAGAPARQFVVAGPTDGTLIFMGQVHEVTRAALMRSVPNPMTVENFTPVAMIGEVPNVLVVNPKIPANSVQEMVRWAQAGQRELNYGIGSIGNLQNLAGLLFAQQTGVALKAIPYRGSGPAITDLLSGQIHMLFETMPATLGHISAGKLRPLAVTSAARSMALPQVPTFAEAGLPKMQMATWYGAFVRAGTPEATVRAVARLFAAALDSSSMRTSWREAGLAAPPYPSGEKFIAFVHSEEARWQDLVRVTGARIDE